ncbi:hypothetical protein [Arthrobacter crystallopoietes]|uniref:hypothetical protein n=1 Tax=Crystallibacter crystallopoietes TaxID=37928 RepID=UPI0011111426|nr:hypothetical protein [Arthrobacter crystallopoietes]QTG82031.1 hypothetical protein J5251_05465 [Arthrobacter crystallopoietes]
MTLTAGTPHRPAQPPIGLLLDVDGPIASPVSRTVPTSILEALLTMASKGWPVVFNTGRSDAFIREQVMEPMLAAGIPSGVRFHAVCEKGAVWFSFGAEGPGTIHVDRSLSVPQDYAAEIRQLVATRYSSHMFFDETKHAMVSVEQVVEADNLEYRQLQEEFDAEALALMGKFNLGASRLDHHAPDSDDQVDYRLDPTIISTDIESIRLGKDLGAQRALEMLAAEGVIPHAWRTMGDSRTDYAMADTLHHNGHAVVHVDVRPADGIPQKPYPVLTAAHLGFPESIHEYSGGAFLRTWAAIAKTL